MMMYWTYVHIIIFFSLQSKSFSKTIGSIGIRQNSSALKFVRPDEFHFALDVEFDSEDVFVHQLPANVLRSACSLLLGVVDLPLISVERIRISSRAQQPTASVAARPPQAAASAAASTVAPSAASAGGALMALGSDAAPIEIRSTTATASTASSNIFDAMHRSASLSASLSAESFTAAEEAAAREARDLSSPFALSTYSRTTSASCSNVSIGDVGGDAADETSPLVDARSSDGPNRMQTGGRSVDAALWAARQAIAAAEVEEVEASRLLRLFRETGTQSELNSDLISESGGATTVPVTGTDLSAEEEVASSIADSVIAAAAAELIEDEHEEDAFSRRLSQHASRMRFQDHQVPADATRTVVESSASVTESDLPLRLQVARAARAARTAHFTSLAPRTISQSPIRNFSHGSSLRGEDHTRDDGGVSAAAGGGIDARGRDTSSVTTPRASGLAGLVGLSTAGLNHAEPTTSPASYTARWRLVFAADASQFTDALTSRCITFRCKMAACVVAGGGGSFEDRGHFGSIGVPTDVCMPLQPVPIADLNRVAIETAALERLRAAHNDAASGEEVRNSNDSVLRCDAPLITVATVVRAKTGGAASR